MSNPAVFAALVLSSVFTAFPATAQRVVKLNGQIHDGRGGPFKAGTVYWIKSDGSALGGVVPAGKTLTIEPGAIIKFQFNSLTVYGTLNAKGAVFTSLNDDTVGGDTNGNGRLTVPRRGDWQFLEFVSGSRSLPIRAGFATEARAGGRR